jgi:alkylhydroperoxidase/carboxymuconolactone decarboxylase family protein YurZ
MKSNRPITTDLTCSDRCPRPSDVSIHTKWILPQATVNNPEVFTNGLPFVTCRSRDSSVLLNESETGTNEKTKGKAMTTRANCKSQSPELFKKCAEFNNLVKEGAIEENVRDLVAIGASQLSGCALCLNTFCLRNT